MANFVKFLNGTAAEYAALATKSFDTFYKTTDTNELYFGSKKITNAADLEAALTRLDGDEATTNSIRNIVKGYIEGLDTNADVVIASEAGGVVTLKAGVKEVDGVIAQGTGSDITLAKAATTGAAEDIAITDEGGNLDATNVEDALAELAEAIADATSAGAVTCETSDPVSGDILRTYSFYQGVEAGDDAAAKAAKKIVDVNVPRDYLVKEAEVKTVDTADDPYSGAEVGDKYIDFTVNTKDSAGTATHLYIPVDELMSAISAAQGATQVQVAISATNEISATLVAGGVGTTELADSAVTTAKIADDAVTADKVAIAAHTESQTAGADGLAISVTTTDGQVSGVTASIAAETYDEFGAADAAKAEVIGTGTGRTGSGTEQDPYVYEDTIKGVKTLVDDTAADAAAAVADLDVSEFALASVASNVVTIKGIKEVDGKIAAGTDTTKDITLEEVAYTGAAADVALEDAGNNYTATTVEAALQEIAQSLQWQPIVSE